MEGLKLPPLYGWQADALQAWRASGRQGIVEAVTGTGKTRVAMDAIVEALDEGRRVAVLVPGRELQEQWRRGLRRALPGSVRIGTLGGGWKDTLRTHDVVVAIVNSARDNRLNPSGSPLLVADECHRYASRENKTALDPAFTLRLGLTATLERPDRLEQLLVDYFGPRCFEMSYPQAIADEVTAHFSVALVGARMAPNEAIHYQELTDAIADRLSELIDVHGLNPRPFHRFMAAVKDLAESQPSRAQRCASQFLTKLYQRKHLLANSPTKQRLVSQLTPAIEAADRTLVFTDSIDGAAEVADRLRRRGLVAETIHADLTAVERSEVVARFGNGRIQVLAAPRVLDEGIDVPAADLAIIVAASRTRRQMIQRMGRVLRRKPDDRLARFAILYLAGTTEDPSRGAHEAFLGEVLPVADQRQAFDADRDLAEAIGFLSQRVPTTPPGPPRAADEPPRTADRHIEDDEAFDVHAVLNLDSPTGSPRSRRHSVSSSRRPAPTRRLAAPPPSRAIRSRGAPKPAPDATKTARYEGLRAAFIEEYWPVSRNDLDELASTLPELMHVFEDPVLLAAFKKTRTISELRATSNKIKRRMIEIQQPRSVPRSGTTITPPKKRKNVRPAGAAAGEKPHAADGGAPTRYCLSCGFREEACIC